MKPHVWEIELVSAPGIAENDEFWICHGCGASGGPKGPFFSKKEGPPTLGPFLAGHGFRLTVGGEEREISKTDCDDAAKLIAEYRAELATRPPPNTEYITRMKAASTTASRVFTLASRQRFVLGQHVKHRRKDHAGWVDGVFLTLESAGQMGAIPGDWYERLVDAPETPKNGIWYSVVMPDGAILVGQDDLIALDAPPRPEMDKP